MKPPTFEDYLQEFHAEQDTRSHNAAEAQEAYENWIENLEPIEVYWFADRALQQERERISK